MIVFDFAVLSTVLLVLVLGAAVAVRLIQRIPPAPRDVVHQEASRQDRTVVLLVLVALLIFLLVVVAGALAALYMSTHR